MAKARPSIAGETQTDMEEREARALEAIAAARDSAGAGAQWIVLLHRLAGPDRKKDGSENRLRNVAIEDLEGVPDLLKTEYGDGIYRIRVRRDNSVIAQWDVNIELSPVERAAFREKLRKLEAGPLALPAPAGEHGQGMGEIARVIGEAMRYQADAMRDLVATLRPAAPPAAPVDPVESFGKMLETFKSFQGALPRSEAETGINMFNKGFELAEKLLDKAGGKDDAPSLLGVLKDLAGNPEVLSTLKELGRANMQRQPPARQIGQQPPGPRRADVGQVAPVPGARREPAPGAPAQEFPAQEFTDADAAAMQYLIKQAENGVQPELCADTALELIPQERLNVLDTMPAEQALDLLMQFYPAAEPHWAWFAALLRAMYEPEGVQHAEPDDAGAVPQSPSG